MTVRWTVRAATGLAAARLSAKLTEGEKVFRISNGFRHMCNFWTLSPSHGLGRASPLPEGAFAPTCLFRQADTTFSGGVFGRFLRILHLSYSVMHIRSHPLRDAPGCAWIFPRTKKVFAGHFFTPPSVGPSFQIPPSPPKKDTTFSGGVFGGEGGI